MSEQKPPKTTDALTRRNLIPFKLAFLAFKLMDKSGQKAMAEVIKQGSRSVNRAHYESRMASPERLGLRTRNGVTSAKRIVPFDRSKANWRTE